MFCAVVVNPPSGVEADAILNVVNFELRVLNFELNRPFKIQP